MITVVQAVLIVLQVFQVAFLWLHDWVPLRRLNDVKAVQAADSRKHLVIVTLIQSVPFTLGLIFALINLRGRWPHWVESWLLISYGLLLLGELRAWWFPYLVRADAQRAERYRAMFGNTHSFLPVRNGFAPNTLHIMLHVTTLGTVALLVVHALWV